MFCSVLTQSQGVKLFPAPTYESSFSEDSENSSLGKGHQIPYRIGITGSPGTGKKTVGRVLAEITGREFLSISEYAIIRKFGTFKDKEFEVDLLRTKRSIDARGKIVCGHLLPYVLPSSSLDFVAILRCSPTVLRKRYIARSYPESKIAENLEAEFIGVVASEALSVYGRRRLAEFDTTRTKNPRTVAKRILEAMRDNRLRHFGQIDWMRSNSFLHRTAR